MLGRWQLLYKNHWIHEQFLAMTFILKIYLPKYTVFLMSRHYRKSLLKLKPVIKVILNYILISETKVNKKQFSGLFNLYILR